MTENNYNKLIDAICELVNLAYDATTSKEEFERLDNAGADIIDCLEKLQQFEAIGTIEEFKDLKEKATPKKLEIDKFWGYGDLMCPNCKSYKIRNPKYCCDCGQKLDWQ